VDLCLSLFPWAKFRTTKGGIKLHALLDHDGYIPAFIKIT
jgi:putative transposase